MQNDIPVSLAGDKLKGAKRIADFLGEDWRRTANLLRSGILPAGKIGHDWAASKQVITEHYRKLTMGQL